MRVLAAALAALLLVAICSLAEADRRVSRSAIMNVAGSTICCSHFLRRIPHRMISSAYMTSNACGRAAVILITKKGRELCADPEDPWVQKYLEQLEH